jgi:tetratricopeptide (TPR) repeat protein
VKRFVAAVATVTALSTVGCSENKSQAEQASNALSAGLRAQVAGRSAEAVKDYRKVLAHDPKNKFAFYNLGLIDQRAGRTASAEQFYRQALAVDPEYVPALFNLAIVVTSQSADEAVTLYRKVIALQPENASATLNLGLLLRAAGQTDEGDSLVTKAHTLDPSVATPTTIS